MGGPAYGVHGEDDLLQLLHVAKGPAQKVPFKGRIKRFVDSEDESRKVLLCEKKDKEDKEEEYLSVSDILLSPTFSTYIYVH